MINVSFTDEDGKAHDQFTESPEFQTSDGIDYVKFDGMPYDLRESILHHPSYDSSKMKFLPRQCGCGKAAFIQTEHFNQLTNNFNNLAYYSSLNLEC